MEEKSVKIGGKKSARKRQSPLQNLLEYMFGHKYYLLVFTCKAMVGHETCGIVFPDRKTAELYGIWFLGDVDSYTKFTVKSFRSRNYMTSEHLYHKDFVRLLEC